MKPRHKAMVASAGLPFLSEAHWYQLVKGYWFFPEESLPEVEVAALREEHRVWLADLQAYAETHQAPRFRDTLQAWLETRGIPLKPGWLEAPGDA